MFNDILNTCGVDLYIALFSQSPIPAKYDLLARNVCSGDHKVRGERRGRERDWVYVLCVSERERERERENR